MTGQGRKRKKNPNRNKVRPHQEGEQGESEPGPSPQRETHSSVEGDESRSPEDEGWNLSHFVVRSPIPMVWTDSNERILGFNEAFCHFSGFPKKRISGQPLNVLLPGWETLKPLVLNGQPACTVMTLAEANAESTLTGQNVKVQCVPSDCGFLVQFYRPLTHTDKTPFYFPKGLTGRQDPDWVILTLDSNFHIIDFTGNCESVTGYSGDEIAGKTADKLFPTWNALIYNLFDGSDAVGQQLSKGLEIIKRDGSCEVLGAYFSRFISGSFYLMLRKYPENRRKKSPFPADEELYRFLIENLNDLVVIVNQNHQLTYVSPSYCQFFAKREEELIGHSFFPLIHPDDRESTARIMEELKNPPHRCYVEQRVMDGNGEWKWLAWSDRAIVDPFGEVKEVIGVGRDITEKKRAEEALQASEEKYRKLHESLRDGFARSDLSGRLLEFNEAFKKITGYNDEELQLTNFRNFTPENWVSIEDEMLQNQLFKRGYTDVYEKEYYHKDGHRIPVEVRAYLLKDDAGSPSGIWAIIRDITERKMVEKELRLLRSIVEISTEAIAISTPEGNLVYVNPAHEQLFGRSVSSFPRINFRDFYPPESIAYLDTHVIPTLMKGIP